MAPIRRRRTTSTTATAHTTPIARSHTIPSVDWHPEPPPTDEPPPPAWYPTLDLFTLYHLRQISPSTQTLVPAQRLSSLPSYACTTSSTEPTVQPANDCPLPTYTVKSHSSGGLLNRKPDIILTRHHDHDLDHPSPTPQHPRKPPSSPTTTTVVVAEGRFDRVSSRTFLSYPCHTAPLKPKPTAEMDVESSLTQKHVLFLRGRVCVWQPTDPDSKRCLELRCSEDGLMACWTYANEPNRWGYGAPEDATGEIGVLQVSQRLFFGVGEGEVEEEEEEEREKRERMLEQVLCSAVVLVERIKRRSAILGSRQVGNGLRQM